jgi:predicted transcriptional regulator
LKYRSRTEIITSILQAAEHGNVKTRVMYEACISYDMLKMYLAFLEKNDLVSIKDKKVTTTAKGKKFLHAVSETEKFLK